MNNQPAQRKDAHMESFICKTCGTHTPIIDRKAPGLCVMCQTTDPNNAGDAP